jgi:hypothetical protein
VAAPLHAEEHLGWPVPDAARRRGPGVHRDHALAPRTRARRQFAALRLGPTGRVIIGATRRCWPSRRQPRGRAGKRAPGRAWPRVYLIRSAPDAQSRAKIAAALSHRVRGRSLSASRTFPRPLRGFPCR